MINNCFHDHTVVDHTHQLLTALHDALQHKISLPKSTCLATFLGFDVAPSPLYVPFSLT